MSDRELTTADKADIVWRLRANWSYLGREAADEITRLRNQAEQLRSELADAKKWAMSERRQRMALWKSEWISVRDRLSPLDERVLYVHEIDGTFPHEANAGRWDGRRTLAVPGREPACVMDYGDEDGDWEPCTHWMPLPAPPMDAK